MKKRVRFFTLFLVLVLVFFYSQNNWIKKSRYEIKLNNLPNSFNGFKIIQISDLHSKSFGSRNDKLIEIVEKADPDIIVITGDMVDDKNKNDKAAMDLIKGIFDIAPIYYVTGNHEFWSSSFDKLEDEFNELGVNMLKNKYGEIIYNGESIYLIGIDDPSYKKGYSNEMISEESFIKANAGINKDKFKILLSHRPDIYSFYHTHGVDIMFSGHVHGGQFRLPFIGGLISPDRGFFPKITSGIHKEKDLTLVMSRGLGNSIIPQRLFNRPEVVEVVLKK